MIQLNKSFPLSKKGKKGEASNKHSSIAWTIFTLQSSQIDDDVLFIVCLQTYLLSALQQNHVSYFEAFYQQVMSELLNASSIRRLWQK